MPRLLLCGFLFFLMLSGANAADLKTDAIKEAEQIITEYRNLRSKCTYAKNAARKSCFSQLESKNANYSRAKKILAEKKTADNLRIVSLSQ